MSSNALCALVPEESSELPVAFVFASSSSLHSFTPSFPPIRFTHSKNILCLLSIVALLELWIWADRRSLFWFIWLRDIITWDEGCNTSNSVNPLSNSIFCFTLLTEVVLWAVSVILAKDFSICFIWGKAPEVLFLRSSRYNCSNFSLSGVFIKLSFFDSSSLLPAPNSDAAFREYSVRKHQGRSVRGPNSDPWYRYLGSWAISSSSKRQYMQYHSVAVFPEGTVGWR